MPKFYTSLRIDLSMTSVTVTCPAQGSDGEPALLATCSFDKKTPMAVAVALGHALSKTGLDRRTAAIVLSDEWARIFMVTPPTNTERMRDCQAALALRFQLLFGETHGDWSVQADWNAGHPFLACALPKALGDAVLHSCAENGVSVVSMVPRFIRCWNRWHRHLGESTWFGIVHTGSLTLAAIEGGRLVEIRRVTVPQQALQKQAWLNDQVGRETLRLGLPMPRNLRLCGDIPDMWLAQSNGAGIDVRRLDPVPAAIEPAGVDTTAVLAGNEV